MRLAVGQVNCSGVAERERAANKSQLWKFDWCADDNTIGKCRRSCDSPRTTNYSEPLSTIFADEQPAVQLSSCPAVGAILIMQSAWCSMNKSLPLAGSLWQMECHSRLSQFKWGLSSIRQAGANLIAAYAKTRVISQTTCWKLYLFLQQVNVPKSLKYSAKWPKGCWVWSVYICTYIYIDICMWVCSLNKNKSENYKQPNN